MPNAQCRMLTAQVAETLRTYILHFALCISDPTFSPALEVYALSNHLEPTGARESSDGRVGRARSTNPRSVVALGTAVADAGVCRSGCWLTGQCQHRDRRLRADPVLRQRRAARRSRGRPHAEQPHNAARVVGG